ncbi:MAG: hypothetical protein ABII68_09940 [Pseudomonadota bacterium]
METNNRVDIKVEGRRSGSDRRTLADPDYRGLERRVAGDRRKGIRDRKHPRFRSKDLTFVKLSAEYKEDVGQLLDICKEGLSVRHFTSEEKSRNYSDLGIFVHGGNFSVDWIPFKTVSDTELANKSPFSTVTFRRYGVKFGDLTPEQAAKLDHFLLNHTLGIA